jgi:hypothetical protein
MLYRKLNRITGAIAVLFGAVILLGTLDGAAWRVGRTAGFAAAALFLLGGLRLLITGRRPFDTPDEPKG